MATQEKHEIEKIAPHSGMSNEQAFEPPWAEVAVFWPTHVEPQLPRTRPQVGTWEDLRHHKRWHLEVCRRQQVAFLIADMNTCKLFLENKNEVRMEVTETRVTTKALTVYPETQKCGIIMGISEIKRLRQLETSTMTLQQRTRGIRV